MRTKKQPELVPVVCCYNCKHANIKTNRYMLVSCQCSADQDPVNRDVYLERQNCEAYQTREPHPAFATIIMKEVKP